MGKLNINFDQPRPQRQSRSTHLKMHSTKHQVSNMRWTFSGCTVNDAAALAVNNVGAFWGQPYWRMIWPADAQLPYITEQMRKRMATSVLLKDRDERRHEMAVDEDTGAVVGYARWLVPPPLQSEWTDGQVPDVEDNAKKALEELADSAVWNVGAGTNINTDVLDAKIAATKRRILAEREFIRESFVRNGRSPCRLPHTKRK